MLKWIDRHASVVVTLGLLGLFALAFWTFSLANQIKDSTDSRALNGAFNVEAWCNGVNRDSAYNRAYFNQSAAAGQKLIQDAQQAVKGKLGHLPPRERQFLDLYLQSILDVERAAPNLIKLHEYRLRPLPCEALVRRTLEASKRRGSIRDHPLVYRVSRELGHPRKKPKAPPTLPSPVPGHPCDPSHYYMNCVQQAVRPPPPGFLAAPVWAKGIDCAWGCPSPAGLRARYPRSSDFVAGYLSYDPGKNLHPAQVAAYHHAGIATVEVWETTASRATQGYSAGRFDALEARRQAAVNGNTSRPIFFAVDEEDSAFRSRSYFIGVGSVLPLSRIGAYGGIGTIRNLFDAHLVSYGWQTYAWSNGAWDGRAHLRQVLNSDLVDYDQAVSPDYGQSPYSAGPRPAPHSAKERALWHEYRLRNGRHQFLLAHNCHSRPLRAKPARFRHACIVVKSRGDAGNRLIVKLKRELHLR